MTDFEQIPHFVKTTRKLAGLTQQDLADMAGVSRTSIQRIEDGHKGTTLDTLFKVFQTLNIQLEFIPPYKDIS